MSSPDSALYESLTVYDRDPYSMLQAAIADAQAKFPGFNSRVGSLQMVILEALCLIASEKVFAINRLPDQIMIDLMQTFGITRDLGTPPEVNVNALAVDSTGWDLEAGLVFRMYDLNGNSIDFETTAAATIPVGVSFALLPAKATTNTDIFNGTAGGHSLVLLTPHPAIDYALTQNAVSGGASPETDEEWRNRAVELISSLSSVCVHADHFTSRALLYPSVYRAHTRDNWNVTTSAAGHVTVAVTDSAGGPLSTDQKTAITADLDFLAFAALTVHVVDADYNVIDTEVTVKAKPNYNVETVEDSIRVMLQDYLSDTTWDWGDTVRINELISAVDQVEGVDYVSALEATITGGTMGAVDVELTGSFPLARSGAHTITVTAP